LSSWENSVFILYALLTDQSIALLFIAGILPGILLITLFMLSICLRARKNSSLGPPGPKTTMIEKVHSLKGVWATLVLFSIVIGGMYLGVFTPTEGGGIGAFGAFVIGFVRGRLKWQGILSSLLEAGKISAVCIGILLGAQIFGYFLAASKLPIVLAGFVTNLAVPSIVIVCVVILIIFPKIALFLPNLLGN
jgi:TRAP-type C4-dicarboxylate transport system permease large subunit